MTANIRAILSKEAFMLAQRQTIVLHGPQPVTKADLLGLSRELPETAYRLYLACDEHTTPETVLCRDLFEMPERRQFPELAEENTVCGDR